MMVAFCAPAFRPWVSGLPLKMVTRPFNLNPSPVPPTTAVLQTPTSAPSSSPVDNDLTLQSINESQSIQTNPNKSEDEAWESLKGIIPFQTLRKIEKPGQYLGNEFGAQHKQWDSAKVKFCLAYPDLYSIGLSSTGHVILYSCLNDNPDILCDRSYLPGLDMQSALQDNNKSLFAVESHRPLTDFDVIGMSLSYELGATNCVKILQLSCIPYTWQERDSVSKRFKDGPPLIFAGGITVTANPEPYADIFDFFSIGDGEEMLPEIGKVVANILEEFPDISRHDLLLSLVQKVSGVYVPRFYDACVDGAVRPNRTDVPAKIKKRNSLPQPSRATALVPISDPVHDRLTVEIRRGCTRGCRFCLPGNVQRPARDVDPEEVKRTVLKGVHETGYNEFSLLSLSCSDWLSLPAVGIQLKNDLKKEEESITLSLGSQRVDRFDENIANVVGGLRHSGLTFAPEAGTQRMRDVINKGLSNEELARGVKLAYDSGYQQVKLYFMINLPSETDEDVLGIVETIKWLQRLCRTNGRKRMSINVTISTFTPKSWTPFQWHSSSIEEVKRKQKMVLQGLRREADVKVSVTDIMLSSMEDFIGRGDRRLGKVIIRAHELGAGMDAWWETMNEAYNAWCQAIREMGLEWRYRRNENGEWNIAETEAEEIRGKKGWYQSIREGNLDRKNLLPKNSNVSFGEKSSSETSTETSSKTQSPLDRPLPWDHIDVGLDKGWLRDELMKALTESLTPDCAFHECSSCGVCGDEMGNNITIEPPPIPKYEGVFQPSTDSIQRFRVAFKKRGSFSLASHLDVARMLDRLLRKASIPMSFTGKFSPHPRIIVAAALPFGATADEELVDFILRKEMDLGDFQSRLEEHIPQGMEIVWVKTVPVREPNVSTFMKSSHFVIGIVPKDENENVDWEVVVEKVKGHKEPVFVDKITKRGRLSRREIRSQLLDIRMATSDEAIPVLEHVGVGNWPSNAGVLFCEAELVNAAALNPDALINLINIIMGDTSKYELLHCHRKKIQLNELITPSIKSRIVDSVAEGPKASLLP